MVNSKILRPVESREDFVEFYEEIGELGIERSIYLRDLVADARRRRISEVLLENISEGTIALDIGCYDGTYFETLAIRSHTIIGVDIARSALLGGKESVKTSGPSIHWVRGDAEQLPLADGSVDFVLLSETLEHLHNPQQAMTECFRVLRDSGLLVLSTPNAVVVKSKSVFDIMRNLIQEPSVGTSEAQRNDKLVNLGVRHDAYVHESYTIAQLAEMGEEAGFRIVASETCAPAPPRIIVEKVLEKSRGLYGVLSNAFRYWPILRSIGNHSIVVMSRQGR